MRAPLSLAPLTALFAAAALPGGAAAQCTLPETTVLEPQSPTGDVRLGLSLAAEDGVLVAATNSSNPTYVYRFQGGQWVEEAQLPATGAHVATDGARICVAGGKTARVYVDDGTGWVLEQTIQGNPVTAAFSAVDIDGDVLVLGDPKASWGSFQSGVGHIFRFDGVQWNEEWYGTFGGAGAEFGSSAVAEGSLVAFGSPNPGCFEGCPPGQVYPFTDTGTGWSVGSPFSETGGGPWQDDGYATGAGLALDQGRFLVGITGDDWGGWTDVGSAELRSDGLAFEQFLTGPLLADDEQYGSACALRGGFALVGGEESGFQVNQGGTASAWRDNGGSWSPLKTLLASDLAIGDRFGASVAVDSGTLLVGAPLRQEQFTTGGIYVYPADDLALDCQPPAALPGGQVNAVTCGGKPGALCVTAIVSPGFAILSVLTFDAEGRVLLPGPIPPGLTGLTIQLQSYGFYQTGVAGYSNVFSLPFL